VLLGRIAVVVRQIPTGLSCVEFIAIDCRARDESKRLGLTVQRDESSTEAEKISSAGAIDGRKQAGNLQVTIVGQAAIDPLMEAWSALGRRDYATAQQLFEACDRKDLVAAIEEALLSLEHRDYATALRLFEALGQKSFASSEVQKSGLAILAPAEAVALQAGPISGFGSEAQLKPAASPARVIPFVDVRFRLDLPQTKKAERRGSRQPLIGVGLALSMAFGAIAILGPPPNWRFAVEQAIGFVASAVSAFKAPGTIALQTARGEQPSSMDGQDSVLPTAATPSGASRSQESGYGSAAAQLYSKGDAAGLGVLAKGARDPDERLALEWASLRLDSHPSVPAAAAFVQAHPGWPDGGWLRRLREAALLGSSEAPAKVAAYFASESPQTSAGMIADARAANATGRSDEGVRIIRALWRDSNLAPSTETLILREFGAALTRADHEYRADRLLYAESFDSALRAATLAGPDIAVLARARVAAARGQLTPPIVMTVPPPLRNDPGLVFARIQDARRSNRAYEAAVLLELAPRDREALVNPDRWWSERRKVAGELLDLGEPRLAFELCDNMVRPDDPANQVDANFFAGWIALRFLNDARAAALRFERAAEVARTPISIARAAYWRGRAAEAFGDSDEAKVFYESAASEPIAYYGQLAAQRLGEKGLTLRAPISTAEGDRRDDAVRVAEALYADGLDELASRLAFDAARQWRDESQLAAMADVIKRFGNAATEVAFGKIASNRGYHFDAMAFPISGVPTFLPLAHSADLARIYSVARQESEFIWQASSGAGAKGLMQLLPSTAASTARRAGVAFDYARLLADPAFNTQLGAAFLGQILEDEGGSDALAFAAYNAGGGRVAQWIAAHGDPRTGSADLVDWIERIPYDETRDYVERVSENLSVYRQRLADEPPSPAPMSLLLARE
jgi:soluble lytic murein transglycosylase